MWIRQYASKRWHLLKKDDPELAVCGKRVLARRTADTPEWHNACRGCLIIRNRKRVRYS